MLDRQGNGYSDDAYFYYECFFQRPPPQNPEFVEVTTRPQRRAEAKRPPTTTTTTTTTACDTNNDKDKSQHNPSRTPLKKKSTNPFDDDDDDDATPPTQQKQQQVPMNGSGTPENRNSKNNDSPKNPFVENVNTVNRTAPAETNATSKNPFVQDDNETTRDATSDTLKNEKLPPDWLRFDDVNDKNKDNEPGSRRPRRASLGAAGKMFWNGKHTARQTGATTSHLREEAKINESCESSAFDILRDTSFHILHTAREFGKKHQPMTKVKQQFRRGVAPKRKQQQQQQQQPEQPEVFEARLY